MSDPTLSLADRGTTPVSKLFCDPSADLTVQSSDGVIFKIFVKDLEAFSNGFPSTDLLADTRDTVYLPETSTVLEILFQFTLRQRHPDPSHLNFETLAELAEAVEKYEVFHATELCKTHMALAVKEHPMEVLGYAVRHGYREIRDQAAPLSLDGSFDLARKSLSTDALLAWAAYREEFLTVMKRMKGAHPTPLIHNRGLIDCGKWRLFRELVLTRVVVPSSLTRISRIFDECKTKEDISGVEGCRHCSRSADNWWSSIVVETSAIPAFHNFF